MKKYLILSAIFLGLVLVGAVSYVEPFTNNVDVNDYNISNADWISANYFNGTLTGESEADMNWTFLKNYPTACPGSSAITALNDSVTCSDLWVDVAGDNMTGQLRITDQLWVNSPIVDAQIRLASADTYKWLYGNDASESHAFYIRAAGGDAEQRVTILQNGDFGISALLPSEKLHVAGNIFLQNDSDKLFFGQAKDVSMNFNGTDFVETAEVGSFSRFWNGFTNFFFSGNVDVEGNVTAENVYLPAYLRVASNSTIPVIGISNWTNITFSKQAPTLKENIEHTWNDSTNTTITINDAGVYQISYSISIKDASPSPDAHVGFRLMDGGTFISGSYSEIDTSKENEEIFIEKSFITSFEAGGTAHLQFTASDVDVSVIPHGTYQASPSSAQISIHKISN